MTFEHTRELLRKMESPHTVQHDLPCPWCGSDVTLPTKSRFGSRYFVQCSNENCHVSPCAEGGTPEECLAVWNDRP